MKISTKQITIGGALLAIMIGSQFFKGVSVYITGPIVNLCLIIATLSLGLGMGIVLSIVAPITSYFISVSSSPIMTGMPLVVPAIMMGNIVLCVFVTLFYKMIKAKWGLPVGILAGAVTKALFMAAVIVNCLLPMFSESIKEALIKIKNPPEEAVGKALETVMAAAKIQFSVTQLITALAGGVLAYIIWITVGKFLKNEARDIKKAD